MSAVRDEDFYLQEEGDVNHRRPGGAVFLSIAFMVIFIFSIFAFLRFDALSEEISVNKTDSVVNMLNVLGSCFIGLFSALLALYLVGVQVNLSKMRYKVFQRLLPKKGAMFFLAMCLISGILLIFWPVLFSADMLVYGVIFSVMVVCVFMIGLAFLFKSFFNFLDPFRQIDVLGDEAMKSVSRIRSGESKGNLANSYDKVVDYGCNSIRDVMVFARFYARSDDYDVSLHAYRELFRVVRLCSDTLFMNEFGEGDCEKGSITCENEVHRFFRYLIGLLRSDARRAIDEFDRNRVLYTVILMIDIVKLIRGARGNYSIVDWLWRELLEVSWSLFDKRMTEQAYTALDAILEEGRSFVGYEHGDSAIESIKFIGRVVKLSLDDAEFYETFDMSLEFLGDAVVLMLKDWNEDCDEMMEYVDFSMSEVVKTVSSRNIRYDRRESLLVPSFNNINRFVEKIINHLFAVENSGVVDNDFKGLVLSEGKAFSLVMDLFSNMFALHVEVEKEKRDGINGFPVNHVFSCAILQLSSADKPWMTHQSKEACAMRSIGFLSLVRKFNQFDLYGKNVLSLESTMFAS